MNVDESLVQACTPGIAQGSSKYNLGYGNLYYALVRQLRPAHVLVIGSGYGFAPAVMAIGLEHNGVGRLTFVDPSMDVGRDGLNSAHGGSGQWDTEEQALARFDCAGVPRGVITHFKETNHEFFGRYEARAMPPVDLALIDGAHDGANASYDLASVVKRLRIPGYVLMHDATHFLNRTPYMGVTETIEKARTSPFVEQVLFPGEAGLSLMRFTGRPNLEVQTAPPPSVLWPIAGVAVAGIVVGVGGMLIWRWLS